MLPKKLTGALAASCAFVLSFVILTSFSTAGKQTCNVTCTFSPTTSKISLASVDNCNGVNWQNNVAAGSSVMFTLDGTGCTTFNITTQVGAVHPAGTVRIYKNGTLVLSHALARNQNLVFDDSFSATCSDVFLVTW